MSEVIELNNHRLLNGDATNRDDVNRLIGDCKVNLLLTDPPYGIDIVKIGGGAIGGEKPPTFHKQRESKWEQYVATNSNHQNHSRGTVGTPARPGFKNLRRGGAKSLW